MVTSIYQEVELSLTENLIPVTVPVKQYDNKARKVRCVLYNNSVEYAVPQECIVACSGTRPDGTIFHYTSETAPDLVFAKNGAVIFTITTFMTAQAGRFPLDVVLLSTDGDVLGAFSLTLKVERAAINNGKIATYTFAAFLKAVRDGIRSLFIDKAGCFGFESEDGLGLSDKSESSSVEKLCNEIVEGSITEDGNIAFETKCDLGLVFTTDEEGHLIVEYTKLSPNHSGQRTHSIDRITPHCVVGQLSAESICGCFTSPTRQASCNYGIGTDGRVSLCVEEKNRSWCSSSNANDQRAVTIECASDKTEPYAMNSAVYAALIKLCTDICQRNGKRKLLWLGDKEKTLNYSPAADEMVLTVHRWFANKSCPGNWLYARMGELAATVTAALGGSSASGLQATSLKNLSEAEAVAKIGPLFTENQKQSGILACVSMAQFILESGYGTSELAQNANNCFGMKTSLSGNTWPNSAWDGKSVYTKKTQEQNDDGSMVTITADFRKYACVEDSIADHAAYLLGAMNGSKKRYEGLAGCTDYKKAVQIIKDGGYATSHTYVQNLCNIIERWNLTQYNVVSGSTTISGWYRVRKTWQNAASQKGAFHDLAYAKQCADANPGYVVFDPAGKAVYPVTQTSSVPYAVRVSINDLNIRKGPGTNYAKTGQYTGKGVFTIVAESAGAGSTKGWGKLKSGAGWVSLDFCTRVG